MIWIHPAALAGLAFLAAPVLVHLLIRHHAARVVFPAMRFVTGIRAAAVRLRTPSDRLLLLLRLAIVALAVLAVAQPVFMTAARTRAWNARVARAVIIDTSASVPVAIATRLGDEAARGAFVSHRLEQDDLRDALRRASDWLATAPAARREIAIVSDFQRGTIDEGDIAGVPASTGIAVFRAGAPNAVTGLRQIDGWRRSRWQPSLAIEPGSTRVSWTRTGETDGPSGLTVRAAAADQRAAERAAEAARSFGVPMAGPSRRIDVAFAGAAVTADTPPATPWIASAAIALRRSALLAETGADVRVAERDGVMAATVSLPATSPLAPAVIRAVLLAGAPDVADREAESTTLDDVVLTRWRRDPTPIAGIPLGPDESDGRWLWALALGLLLVEGLVRRRSTVAEPQEAHADAA
jgi:Aerotolerance regulator N-terminal